MHSSDTVLLITTVPRYEGVSNATAPLWFKEVGILPPWLDKEDNERDRL